MKFSTINGDDTGDFSVDSNGIIRTQRVLDRESRSSYTFSVVAVDQAPNVAKRLQSTAQVNDQHRNIYSFFSPIIIQ